MPIVVNRASWLWGGCVALADFHEYPLSGSPIQNYVDSRNLELHLHRYFANPSKVGKTKSRKVFETIAQCAVHADMGKPDQ